MKRKYEVDKYLKKENRKGFRNYRLDIGGLQLYFDTRTEADEYYQQYLK